MANSYTMTTDTITVVFKGDVHTVRRGAPNFDGLREALHKDDWGKVPGFLTVAKSVESWSKGDFRVSGDSVFIGDEALPQALSRRIISMVTKGEDPSYVLNFWKLLRHNPSKRSVDQLWSFLDHQGIPLTKDGSFLAYKSVRRDLKDHYSGTVDNKVGVVNEMARNKISDDPRQACHEGYHVGALAYANSFGAGDRRIVICKVDPQDVVCVPYDESSRKMRVCRYEVVGHQGSDALPSTVCVEESSMGSSYEDDEDDFDIDEDGFDDGVEDDEEVPIVQAKPKAKTKAVSKSKAKAMAKLKLKAKVKSKAKVDPESEYPLKKSKRGSGWAKFDRMNEDKLLAQSIDSLRKYASNGLFIFGSSKIPGGKLALVARIMDIRES